MFISKRKSYIEQGKIYFWTATINKWLRLLEKDSYKNIIINSLEYLSEKGKMDVFGFVIMPNHIHLVLRINELNGKETAQGSFLKYTAHEFKKNLLNEGPHTLYAFKTTAANKKYEFWKRDSLAVHLYSKEIAFQKLEYIHNNPVTEYWNLAAEPCDYLFSSAGYYEKDEKMYPFLKDLRAEF